MTKKSDREKMIEGWQSSQPEQSEVRMFPYPFKSARFLDTRHVSSRDINDRFQEFGKNLPEAYHAAGAIGKALWVLTQPWLNGGTAIRENGESWYHWRVFPKGTTDDEIAEVFGMAESYSGPSRPFHAEAVIIRKGSRVLARQFGGLDI